MAKKTAYPPELDLLDPKKIFKEIFDDDAWVKDAYLDACQEELEAVCLSLASAFAKVDDFQNLEVTEQSIYVTAFTHGVLDDVLTSLKLIVSGKMVPAGNLMRQAIEGLALAILCSSNEQLIVPLKKGQQVVVKYWEQVRKGDSRVESHHAVAHLDVNRQILNINADIIDELKKARKLYHQFSHPGIVTIQFRVAELSDKITQFVGGTFDPSKVSIYKTEIILRGGFCTILPSAVELMIKNLKHQN